ncbi:hypothetical protein [Xylella fastidiosa]|uniref:Uncharacterized protein n=1 Tax=Xylella fastidiosa subsp. fastidiosa TaxID=644356 RepID=A0AAJ5R087_XYLFS|nr:hypothetical protein [Xylella fastidiosa]WCF28169.1 hypothetical protein OK117_11210 [Xylella fastidiosa subsp. fastidiosa]
MSDLRPPWATLDQSKPSNVSSLSKQTLQRTDSGTLPPETPHPTSLRLPMIDLAIHG